MENRARGCGVTLHAQHVRPGSTSIVKLLLPATANMEAKDKKGKRVEHQASQLGTGNVSGLSLLHVVCAKE